MRQLNTGKLRALAPARLCAREFIDAMPPSNFATANPDIIRTITRPASPAARMQSLSEEIQKGRITR